MNMWLVLRLCGYSVFSVVLCVCWLGSSSISIG